MLIEGVIVELGQFSPQPSFYSGILQLIFNCCAGWPMHTKISDVYIVKKH